LRRGAYPWAHMGGPAREVEAPKRTLDGMEPRRDNIIPGRALAEGNINGGDASWSSYAAPRYAGSDHDPLTAAFHRGYAHKLSKHRE
jgi:hypothetical protein